MCRPQTRGKPAVLTHSPLVPASAEHFACFVSWRRKQVIQDFFVSYNNSDRLWAEWIAWQLEEQGYTTVLQAWDFRPGANFVLAMQRAAAEAERTIVLLSPDYLAAHFTQPEWAAAFVQDPTSQQGRLLPVRIRECTLTGMLRSIVYIDLVGLDEAVARETLLAGVLQGRAKPAAAPSFPGAPSRAVGERPRFPGRRPLWSSEYEALLHRLITNQYRSVRYYIIFSIVLVIFSIIGPSSVYCLVRSSIPERFDNSMIILFVFLGIFIFALCLFPLKEILHHKEKAEIFAEIKTHLPELMQAEDSADQAVRKRVDDLLWQVVEKAALR
jgi:hypothetical protein